MITLLKARKHLNSISKGNFNAGSSDVLLILAFDNINSDEQQHPKDTESKKNSELPLLKED